MTRVHKFVFVFLHRWFWFVRILLARFGWFFPRYINLGYIPSVLAFYSFSHQCHFSWDLRLCIYFTYFGSSRGLCGWFPVRSLQHPRVLFACGHYDGEWPLVSSHKLIVVGEFPTKPTQVTSLSKDTSFMLRKNSCQSQMLAEEHFLRIAPTERDVSEVSSAC